MNVIERIIFIKYNDHYGTGFTVEVNDKQYIITAKHVVEGIKQNDSIFFFQDNQWKKIEVKNIKFKNPKIDAIALVPSIQLTPVTNVEFTSMDIVFGQEVYFLGFPFGFITEVGNLNNNFPMPFVKKGICSNIDNKSTEVNIIWIDGYCNPGFSGGPIVFRDIFTENIKIAGVLVGYLPEHINVIDEKEKTELYVKINSGLIYSIGVDSIIKLIKENQENLNEN
jgi:S1-C subfamily serine protease